MADQLPAGSRIQDFSADVPVTHTFLNDLQDENINALGQRRWNHTSAFQLDAAGSWIGAHSAAGNIEYYLATAINPNGERMWAEIFLPVDAKIIDIDVIYQDSSRNGGEIALYQKQLITVGNTGTLIAASKLFDLGASAANPWNQGGANYYRVRTTCNTVIAAGYKYYVSVQSSTTGAGGSEVFQTLLINAQFSTG